MRVVDGIRTVRADSLEQLDQQAHARDLALVASAAKKRIIRFIPSEALTGGMSIFVPSHALIVLFDKQQIMHFGRSVVVTSHQTPQQTPRQTQQQTQ